MPVSGKQIEDDGLPVLKKKAHKEDTPTDDGLPILKKKESSSQPSPVGGTPVSPSESPLPSASPKPKKRTEDHLNDILQLAKVQQDGMSLFNHVKPVFEEPKDPNKERENNEFLDRIKKGDPEAITQVISKHREGLKKAHDDIKKETSNRFSMPTMGIAPSGDVLKEHEEAVKNQHDLEEREKNVINSGVSVLSNIYAKKWQGEEIKNDITANDLGKELRKHLSDIGADNNFSDQESIVKNVIPNLGKKIAASRFTKQQVANASALGGTLKPNEGGKVVADNKDKLEEYNKANQEYKYGNIAAVYSAHLDDLNQKIGRINENLNKPADFDQLPSDQQAEYKKYIEDYFDSQSQLGSLIDKFPEVKKDHTRGLIADAFAKYVQDNPSNPLNYVPNGKAAQLGINTFVGRSADNEFDYEAIAKMTGLSVDEVKKNRDAAKVPSYLGFAVNEFTGFFKDAEEGINRIAEPKQYADINNRLIENTKYKLPTPLELSTENINAESILYKVFGTGGSVAAFALTAEAGGELTGLGRVASLAKGQLKTLREAEQILPAKNLGETMVKLGLSRTPQEGLEAIASATEKAKNFAGAYSSSYATSYEPAYKEASQHTTDEKKRHQYASEIANANGLSMLIFNSAELANKIVGSASKDEMIASFLASKTPFAEKGVFMKRLGETAKTIGLADAQQLIPMIQEENSKSELFNYHTSSSEFFKKAMNGIVANSIAMLPLGVIGSSKIPSSDLMKESLYEGGKTPKIVNDAIEEKYNRGEITEDQKNSQIKTVNTLAQIVATIPEEVNGKKLTQKQKNEITFHLLKKKASEQAMESADPSFKKHFQEDIKEHQENIDKIVNPEPEKPEPTAEEKKAVEDKKTEVANLTKELPEEFHDKEVNVKSVDEKGKEITETANAGEVHKEMREQYSVLEKVLKECL